MAMISDRVGDELPAGQRIFHADMVHSDAVAHADGVENHRGLPAAAYTPAFTAYHQLIQVEWPGMISLKELAMR